jgi:hypothetical protein
MVMARVSAPHVTRHTSHVTFAGNNLEALMALGVAHTNELSQIQVLLLLAQSAWPRDVVQALHYLQDWLARHPKYKDVSIPLQALVRR